MNFKKVLDKFPVGIFLAILSSSMFAGCFTFSKLILHEISGDAIILVRYTTMAILMVPFILADTKKLELEKFDCFILLLSAVFLYLSNDFQFIALKSILPVDTEALVNMSPIFTLIISAIFLKEKFNLYHFILTILIVISVFMIAQPSFLFTTSLYTTPEQQWAVAIAVLSGLTSSLCDITVRYLKCSSNCVITFVHGVLIALASLIFHKKSLIVPPSANIVGIFILVTAFGIGARFTLVTALQNTTAAMVASCLVAGLVFTIIFQLFLLGTFPNHLSLCGCFVLSICIFLLPLYDQISAWFNKKKNNTEDKNLLTSN